MRLLEQVRVGVGTDQAKVSELYLFSVSKLLI